jgi:FixJ family two-component response regulator
VELFSSAGAFLERAEPAPAGCLVLDLRLPGLNGLELQEELTHRGLDHAIVFITGHGSVQSGVRAMKNGAVDFLPKPFHENDLLPAVARGLQRSRRSAEERAERARAQALWEALTAREREVYALVVSGCLNKQAAVRLGISEKTVKVHRGKVMEKMQASCLAHLIRLYDHLRPGSRNGSAPPGEIP